MPSTVEPNVARAELSRRAVLKLNLASRLLTAGGLVQFLTCESDVGTARNFELDRPNGDPLASIAPGDGPRRAKFFIGEM